MKNEGADDSWMAAEWEDSPLACRHGDRNEKVLVTNAGMFNCSQIPSGAFQLTWLMVQSIPTMRAFEYEWPHKVFYTYIEVSAF